MEKNDIIKVRINILKSICKMWVILNWTAAWYLKHQKEIDIALEILEFIL